MRKIVFALLALIATAEAATAQTARRATVSGVVADASTRQGLVGVIVELVPESDSTRSAVVVTGAGGLFSTGVGRERIAVRAGLAGYGPHSAEGIEIAEARHRLDTIFLQGVRIEGVTVEGVSMRTSLKGDTLIYNADSYKVAGDATVSGLLEKMPGIKVEGGTVEAQGEAVKKVLIDNKEFFGDDVAAAISSLPAEAVKNVEVFDKLSDNAEFTGIDDGEGYKA
ncbi:MAG: TonB-dependent receptor, partial [Alistipes sp.]|nr:TonB-dependent receptor [Alistipes sp.]